MEGLLIDPPHNSGHCAVPTVWVSQVVFQEMILEGFSGVFQIKNRRITSSKKYSDTLGLMQSIEPRFPVRAFIKCQRLKGKKEPPKTWCSRVVLRGWMVDKDGNLLIHINPKLKNGRAKAFRTRKRRPKTSKRLRPIATALTICYTTPVAGSKGGEKPEPQ